MMHPQIDRELAEGRVLALRAEAGAFARGPRGFGRRRGWRFAVGSRLVRAGLRMVGPLGDEAA
jgi:hypothetical protein